MMWVINLFFLLSLQVSASVDGSYNYCSDYKKSATTCDQIFSNRTRHHKFYKQCKVCQSEVTCFWAFDDSKDRGLCQASLEGRSCFTALDRGKDRNWCEVLLENKPCSILNSSIEREGCLKGQVPESFVFWVY